MERPQETGVERYLLTNNMGETIYAYWKVMYEEISEEFLYDSYQIQNVKLEQKGQSRKVSMESERSFGGEVRVGRGSCHIKPTKGGGSTTTAHEWIKNDAGLGMIANSGTNQINEDNAGRAKKVAVSFTPMSLLANAKDAGMLSRKKSGKFCFDEMDLVGTAYKRTTRRAGKKGSLHDDEGIPTVRPLKHSVFVPIAVCIKTANPYSDQAETLLDSIIATLYRNERNYVNELHNTIYSFSEFCSHVLTLTHVTTPPPFTELIVPVCDKEIVYYEGLISNLPCEGDMSVAQLFSLVYTDYIIMLWAALLLEKDVIIYTSNPNLYFYIVKTLIHLMFPLQWQFAKGIIPNLDLLSSPTPYCFGILKSGFDNKASILERLAEDEMQYIMLDIDEDGRHNIQISMKETLVYPREARLKKELDTCCMRYGIIHRGLITMKEDRYVEFSKRVQEIFFNEVAALVKGFDVALKKDKEKTIEGFKREFLTIYAGPGIKPAKKDEAKFIEELTEKQCMAFLYDEAVQEKQSNYARVEAMNVRGKSPPIELLRIMLYSSPTIIMNRLNRLVKAAANAQREEQKSHEEEGTAISLRKKFDWAKEINRMNMIGAIIERSSEIRASLLKQNNNKGMKHSMSSLNVIRSDSSDSSSSSPKQNKGSLMSGDIVMNVEETKEGCSYDAPVMRSLSSPKEKEDAAPPKESEPINKRHIGGPLFYGRKGVLAFLNEFMGLSQKQMEKVGLVEEEKAILEYLRNSLSRTMTSSGGGPSRGTPKESQNDDSDSAHSEGPLAENSPVPVISELVGSLIDIKDFNRVSSFLNRDFQFMYFTSTSCLQFYLVLAFFYARYDQDPMNGIKAFMDAFKYVQNSKTYSSYFPVNYFKALIGKLELEELRKLLPQPGDLTTIVKAVYDKKLIECGLSKKLLVPHSAKVQEKTKKSQKDDVTSCPIPGKNSKVHPEELYPVKKDLREELKDSQSAASVLSQESVSSIDGSVPFLNNYPKMFKTVDPNPNTIIACALKDLILLLTVHKGKGQNMFVAAGKSPHFEVIEKQAAVLKSRHFFEKNKKEPAEGENHWLQTKIEKLTFFMNLHNFTILFGLCKSPPAKFPKSMQEWINYSRSLFIRVGLYTFNALEIHHAILRATLHIPKVFTTSKDLIQGYPRYAPSESKTYFLYLENKPLINFGIHFPFKSNPQLRVYTPDTIMAQLKLNAEQCLSSGKLAACKNKLQLPPIMEMYEEDFLGPDKQREVVIQFVKDHLPASVVSKNATLFATWYI